MDTTTETTGYQYLFGLLTKAMAGNPQIAQRITAHVRAVSNHNTLITYHQNGASEEDKKKLYTECLVAIRSGNFDKLQGQIANGQASVPEEPKTEEKPVSPARDKTPRANLVKRETKPAEPPKEASEAVTDAARSFAPNLPQNEAAAQLIASLNALIQPKTGPAAPAAEIDEARVLMMVSEKVGEVETNLKEFASRMVDNYLKSIPPRDLVEVRHANGTVATVEGLTHWQLPQIITWASADVPVWAWGTAGTGKTTLGRQIAKALQLEPYIISIDPTMTVGKMLGFRNLASGEFVEGFVYKPYKEGGLVVFDEIDTGDPGILASLNALIANDYYLFPNGETVKRHENFRIIAGANTKGNGAVAGYTARNRLDAATLDRFAVIELTIDEDLERAIALGIAKQPGKHWAQVYNNPEMVTKWVDWVQKVRSKVGTSVLVSPRASILGARALRAGVPPVEVAEALVYKLVTDDTRKNIISHCGKFE